MHRVAHCQGQVHPVDMHYPAVLSLTTGSMNLLAEALFDRVCFATDGLQACHPSIGIFGGTMGSASRPFQSRLRTKTFLPVYWCESDKQDLHNPTPENFP